MARSRVGRRARAPNIQSITKARGEPPKRMSIPLETQARIRAVYGASQQRMAAVKNDWEAYLAGIRDTLGVPAGWVLDIDGDQVCFAEPRLPVAPPAPAPAEPAAAETG